MAQEPDHSKEQEYTVTWVINETASNPHEAARKAWEDRNRPGSIANVFMVSGPDGESVVDLSQESRT